MSHGSGAPPGGALAEGVLVSAMWSYANSVLYPYQAMRRLGLAPPATSEGDRPERVHGTGLGPLFSHRYARPVLMETPSEHAELVHEFDRMAEIYDAFVAPFSTPIFDEALRELRPYIRPSGRLLDAGCGAGRELRRMARLVPDGEVVGIDLSAGMVEAAWRDARAHGLANTAFVQSDVGELPQEFNGAFDLVYNCLAHHHYPDPPAAAAAIARVLRPGGLYCVIDPGPAWFTQLTAPLAKWADPGWIGFHTGAEFRQLYLDAGFARAAWVELLPGFGLAIGQTAHQHD